MQKMAEQSESVVEKSTSYVLLYSFAIGFFLSASHSEPESHWKCTSSEAEEVRRVT